eukprot:GEMP01030289.1.p1 GENE.GEMP01030289.1~~GEMP01030289.1.p1  ORF type:complete len:219 (+),score=-26.62 GEMP01030289.1:1317-1973(+)
MENKRKYIPPPLYCPTTPFPSLLYSLSITYYSFTSIPLTKSACGLQFSLRGNILFMLQTSWTKSFFFAGYFRNGFLFGASIFVFPCAAGKVPPTSFTLVCFSNCYFFPPVLPRVRKNNTIPLPWYYRPFFLSIYYRASLYFACKYVSFSPKLKKLNKNKRCVPSFNSTVFFVGIDSRHLRNGAKTDVLEMGSSWISVVLRKLTGRVCFLFAYFRIYAC